MSLSVIKHLVVPGGDCTDPLPRKYAELHFAVTLKVAELLWSVKSQPCAVTVPDPVKTVPPQQARNSPVEVLNRITFVGLESSWRQASNTLTVKLQVAVLPAKSVAVHVTVVVPGGNGVPDGGLQTVTTPGQLSEAVGAGKLAATPAVGGQVIALTAVTLAGQVIEGGCTSMTVIVNVQIGPTVVVQVMVVVPTGKNEPEAGLQLIVPQVPVVVGAG